MKRFFKWLLMLTTVLVVTVLVILYNPSLIKGPLERYLSGLAGYTIYLDGSLEIDPGRITEVTAKNIRVSGPGWASQPNLVEVAYLNFTLKISSLFKEIIVFDSLRVDKLQLNLETGSDGVANWVSANTPAPKTTAARATPLIIFNNIKLNQTGLHYKNEKRGVEHVLYIASLDQQQQANGMLSITLDGAFNNRPVEYAGTIGPYTNLLQGHDITYTGAGHFGTLNITGNGWIDDLTEPRRPRFNLKLNGPDIDEITGMLGFDDLGSGGFSLRAMGEEINDHYEVDINGKIGDISLGVSAVASDLREMEELDLKLAANGPSLGVFARSLGVENWPDKPFNIKGDIDRIGKTLNISKLTLGIGGTELALDALLTNFPNFDASRLRLSIIGDDIAQVRELLDIPGVATGPFEAHGKLDVSPEGVELVLVELQTSLGHLTVSGTLGAAPSYSGSKLHLHLDGDNAHTFMSIFDVDVLPEEPFNLDTLLETTEKGLILKRGVLVTIKDERLELDGFVSFQPGSVGTDIEARVTGQHLAHVLRRILGGTSLPDMPYDISGQIRVQEQGIELENIKARLAGIDLSASGLLSLRDQFLGTSLNLQLSGETLSSLEIFADLEDTLNIFVPGQSFRVEGQLEREHNGWKLNNLQSRIGTTDLNLNAMISNEAEWVGSSARFSIKGPELRSFLVVQSESGLPIGAFESSGQIMMTDDSFSITDFHYDTGSAHASVDLEIGWPVTGAVDAVFNINIQGDDIHHFIPPSGLFTPGFSAFSVEAAGQKRGSLVSLDQFELNLADLMVSLKGTADDNPADESVALTLVAKSSDLSRLGQINGKTLPAMKLDLKAELKGNTQEFVVQNLVGSLGENHIAGSLDVSLRGPRPTINLAVNSNYFDIRPFQQQGDSDDDPTLDSNNDRVIPATPLPLETLNKIDGIFNIRVRELRHLNDSLRDIVIEAELKDGRLHVPLFSLAGPRGSARSSITVNPTGSGRADVALDLSAEKLYLNLSGQPQDRVDNAPAADVELSVNGSGGNFQELASSLNGSLYLGSEGGTLKGVSLSVLDTFILEEVFSLIMPKSDNDDSLQLACAAAAFKITNGFVDTDPAIAFTTERITVVSKGTLDLKNEEIHVNFNATPNKPLNISAGELFNPYILVSGTLSKPSVGIDPTKALLHGGAAIGTAGISILAKGLLDRVNTSSPLCEEMLMQAQQVK